MNNSQSEEQVKDAAEAEGFDAAAHKEEIAQAAYALWEARGKTGGSPEEDWLRAEEEVRRKHAAAASGA